MRAEKRLRAAAAAEITAASATFTERESSNAPELKDLPGRGDGEITRQAPSGFSPLDSGLAQLGEPSLISRFNLNLWLLETPAL
ncbi:MAG: hypothetical protein R3F19_11870 [Verrucomicrobiales bacterium]